MVDLLIILVTVVVAFFWVRVALRAVDYDYDPIGGSLVTLVGAVVIAAIGFVCLLVF